MRWPSSNASSRARAKKNKKASVSIVVFLYLLERNFKLRCLVPMQKTVIIGAGPYGLSIAAHLRHRGVPFRIFGRLMDSWKAHMPKGMCLKSDGFASNIYDPASEFTLRQFCAEKS